MNQNITLFYLFIFERFYNWGNRFLILFYYIWKIIYNFEFKVLLPFQLKITFLAMRGTKTQLNYEKTNKNICVE